MHLQIGRTRKQLMHWVRGYTNGHKPFLSVCTSALRAFAIDFLVRKFFFFSSPCFAFMGKLLAGDSVCAWNWDGIFVHVCACISVRLHASV